MLSGSRSHKYCRRFLLTPCSSYLHIYEPKIAITIISGCGCLWRLHVFDPVQNYLGHPDSTDIINGFLAATEVHHLTPRKHKRVLYYASVCVLTSCLCSSWSWFITRIRQYPEEPVLLLTCVKVYCHICVCVCVCLSVCRYPPLCLWSGG